jgi:hypothetical protein
MKIVSTMEMEDILSFENLVNLYKTLTLNTPKDDNLHQSKIYVHNPDKLRKLI